MSDELGNQLVERFTKEEGHDMSENGFFDNELSRRDAMKTAVKAGAYAAPVVLAASVPGMGVAAASVPGATTTPTATSTVTPVATNTPTPAQVGLQINGSSVTQTPTLRTCTGQPVSPAPGSPADDFQFVESLNIPVSNGGPNTAFDVFISAPNFDPLATGIVTLMGFPSFRVGTFAVGSNGSGTFSGQVTVSAIDNPPVFPNPLTVLFTFAGTQTIAGTQQVSAGNVTNVRCISGPLAA